MKVYQMSYGKTFQPEAGGSITVSNFDLSVSSCNPHGLGGTWGYKNLEELKASLDRIVWITAEERAEIKAEMDRVNQLVMLKADKTVVKISYTLNNEGKFIVRKYNKSGYQVSNGEQVHKDDLTARLAYLEKCYNIKATEACKTCKGLTVIGKGLDTYCPDCVQQEVK